MMISVVEKRQRRVIESAGVKAAKSGQELERIPCLGPE